MELVIMVGARLADPPAAEVVDAAGDVLVALLVVPPQAARVRVRAAASAPAPGTGESVHLGVLLELW
ncbi:MAG TPA: hypothetical protein VIC62_19035 [Nakamurella sp.]|jgi:hypothetical protein